MKCHAVTMHNSTESPCAIVRCEAIVPHVEHWGTVGDECVRWKSPAELDEGVDDYYTAYATESRVDPSKVQWSQLAPFAPALELVARALMHGAKKHSEAPGTEAWRSVENAALIFGDKVARHGLEHVCGRKFDPESKLPHLAHMIANVLIVMMTEGDFIK
jgi:hypothetical protein